MIDESIKQQITLGIAIAVTKGSKDQDPLHAETALALDILHRWKTNHKVNKIRARSNQATQRHILQIRGDLHLGASHKE